MGGIGDLNAEGGRKKPSFEEKNSVSALSYDRFEEAH